MVFCLENVWDILLWPCTPKSNGNIIRTAHLKSYETIVSEEDLGSEESLDEKARDESVNKYCVSNLNGLKKGNVRNRYREERIVEENRAVKDKCFEDLFIEYENTDFDVEDKKKSQGNTGEMFGKIRARGRKEDVMFVKEYDLSSGEASREHLENFDIIRQQQNECKNKKKLSKSSDIEKAKSEKYKDQRGTFHSKGEEDPLWLLECYRVPGIDTENRDSHTNEKRSINNGRTHTRSGISGRSCSEDSDNEIDFVVGLYGKASLNNNLRKKMVEYLNSFSERKTELHKP